MESGLINKFGFNVFNQPPEDFFEYAAINNLKHIEINLTQEHSSLTSFDIKRIRKLNKLASKHKISLSFHLPFTINISEIISLIRKRNIEYLKNCIILGRKLKITHITTHIGNFYWFPSKKIMRQNALDRFVKYLNDIIKICELNKVTLALENVVPIPPGSDYFFLGDSISDFDFIFRNIKSDYLKFCLDTGHANIAEGVIPYMQNYKEKLVAIHYHDNSGFDDEHLPIGKGTVPWKEVMLTLKQIKYRGPIISECRNISHEDAAGIFIQFYNDSAIKNP